MVLGSDFRKLWLSGDTPGFIFAQLVGDAPYG